MNAVDIESVRSEVIKALLAEGRLVANGPVDDATLINAGQFAIDSLAFIRAFITLEDEFDTEFGDEALMQNQFSTFGDVVAYVHQELTARTAS